MENLQDNELVSYIHDTLTNISDQKCIRGKERTVRLHKVAWQSYCKSNQLFEEEWDVTYEYRLLKDGHERTFDIDILAKNKITSEKIVLLVKSVQSDYNKNYNNYKNTILGETSRVLDSKEFEDDTKVVFWNLIPENCPSFNRDGNLKSWQSTKDYVISNKILNSFRKRYSYKLDVVNIKYDIKDRTSLKNKKQFSSLLKEQIQLS